MAAALMLAVTTAAAQPAPQRAPFRGLFGGVAADPNAHDRLAFTFSLAEAYDDDVMFELKPRFDPLIPQASGFFTMLHSSADYSHQGRRVQFVANGMSALRYYPELEKIKSFSHAAGLGLTAQAAKQFTIGLNQTAAYSPSYLFGLLGIAGPTVEGDAPPAPAPDYAAIDRESYSYGTNLRLARTFSRQGRLSATADFRYLDYVHAQENRRDAKTYGIAGDFERGIAKNLLFTSGYHYREGDIGYSTVRSKEHGVDLGFGYTRQFSSLSSAELSFSVGASRLEVPETAETARYAGKHERFTGDVDFAYLFARTWATRANYRRGVEYVAELATPVDIEGATLSLDGLFTRRLDFHASARYATGASALNRDSLFFDTYAGELRLRFALTRTLAAFGEYFYYFYDFRGSTALPEGTPRSLERNGVRAGVTLWLPAFER